MGKINGFLSWLGHSVFGDSHKGVMGPFHELPRVEKSTEPLRGTNVGRSNLQPQQFGQIINEGGSGFYE